MGDAAEGALGRSGGADTALTAGDIDIGGVAQLANVTR